VAKATQWPIVRKGAAWLVGVIVALSGLMGAAAVAASQIALTRELADEVYETKERAETMYNHFEREHQKALNSINDSLKKLVPVPHE
jgi:hypothetical protein